MYYLENSFNSIFCELRGVIAPIAPPSVSTLDVYYVVCITTPIPIFIEIKKKPLSTLYLIYKL